MGVYSGVRPNMLLEGSSVDFENAGVCNGSILELAVECERNDMRMFESVIELDFMEAYQKSVLEAEMPWSQEDKDFEAKKAGNTNTEAAKKSILAKIKELIDTAIKKVKEFFQNMIQKIKTIMDSDRKMVEANKKYWTPIDLKGFKVTDYAPIVDISELVNEFEGNMEDLFESMIDSVDKATTKEEVSKDIYGDLVKKYFAKGDPRSALADATFAEAVKGEAEFVSIDGGEQVKIVKDLLTNGSDMITMVKKDANKMIGLLNQVKRHMKTDVSVAKKENAGELELAKLNAKYKVVNKMVSFVSGYSSGLSTAITKQLSSARKVFITGSRYAKKKAEGKSSVAESAEFEAFNEMLGIASDAYIESVMYSYDVAV